MIKFLLLLIIPLLNFGQNDPTEFCDSIFVSFVEYNEEEQYVAIEFSTQFLTQYWYGYAGFTLTNNSGEIIATETLENAGNVYGIGNNMTETRYLQITENFTAPLGTLNLVNNLFSGASPESVCSWMIYDESLYTYVPDDNFEQRLIDLFFDDVLDNYVLTENISSVEELYICCSNISDLTGIEDFINIKILDCNFNPDLLSLDLSNNTELISISANQISGTENGSLEFIDVSNCSNLETLTCLQAQVSSVDVSNSPNLIVLNIGHNEIETIDVANNIYLETLIIDNNLISEIDVTNNINLNTLDISDNPNLQCADIRNGNNIAITDFFATGSPNLYCINVDDEVYSTDNWINILDQHYFSNSCSDECNSISPNDITWVDPDWADFDWDTYWDDLDLGTIVDWENIPWDLIINSDMQPEDLIYYIISQGITLNGLPFIWDEFIDFSNNSNLNEYRNIRTLVKVVDVLGRDVSKINKDARLLYIFNDGSIEKKYIVK